MRKVTRASLRKRRVIVRRTLEAAGLNSRRTTLIIAIVVAAAVGLLTVRYLTTVAPPAPAVVDTRAVVVASREIHPHEKIQPDMLTLVRRPVDQIVPGAVSDPKAAEGDVSLIAISEGAPLTDTEIGRPAQIGITGKLAHGLRAVSIPVDYVKSVSALVEPGDRVDVLASVAHGGARVPPTRAIIRGALVLAVNSTLEATDASSPAPGGPAAPASVTLAVTAAQADLLTFADLNTTLRIALRDPNEPARSEAVEPLVLPDLAPPAPALAPPAAVSVPPMPSVSGAPPQPKPSTILVIIGDQAQGAGR